MPQPFPRIVIREHLFEETLRKLIPDARSADDYVLAAEFVLARDPRLGQQTSDPNVWALPMAPVRGNEVALYYTTTKSRSFSSRSPNESSQTALSRKTATAVPQRRARALSPIRTGSSAFRAGSTG